MWADNTKRKDCDSVECVSETATPRPFLKWAGGKRQLLPELQRRVPETYSTYYEPFVGSGALFFKLRPKHAYLSDLNPELMNAYAVIKTELDHLIPDLKKHVYEEEYFYTIRYVDRTDAFQNWSNIQRASRLIYLNKTCFNGLYRVNSKGYFNVPFGEYTNPTIFYPENLQACSYALRGATVAAASYLEIEKIITENDFVYFDPPYAPINKTSYFTDYSKEGFDTQMQVELRDLCVRLDARGIKFMVSNSDVDLINDLYKGFNIETVLASRSINSNAALRGQITELIIRNYE